MKITIYELLGLIKDGKAPKKIKYRGKIYIYRNNDGNSIYQYEDSNSVLTIQCFEKLNDEIEIIKEVEDKEYEDIEVLEGTLLEANEDSNLDKRILCCLATTINALIRNQKYILERLDKEDRK